uniref:ARAD1C39446p n=1 Tax=Blastobotrys adeninivorans TaxID=409370 RepID=A0A060T3C4_BLAAD
MSDLFGSDDEVASSRKRNVVESDSESNNDDMPDQSQQEAVQEQQDGSDEDIFGDDDSDQDQDQDQEDRNAPGHPLIQVTIPRYPPSHVNKDDPEGAYFARVPAFMSLDSHPFDVNKFLDAQESASEEQKAGLRVQNENTIRWRYSRDSKGNMTQQSNARFVRWDDGSLSLQLGTEMFDAILKPSEDTFAVRSHPTNELLQTYALLEQQMSFIPTSTSSHTHKRLTADLAKRQLKGASVKSFVTTDDPEKIKREAEKAEEINIRARRKLESKRRQIEERTGMFSHSGPSTSYSTGADHGGYSRDNYEEDDFVVEDDESEEEEGAQRLQRLKQRGAQEYSNRDYDDDEDEEDEEAEEEEEEEQQDEQEEQNDNVRTKKRRIIDDDDSD